MVVVSHMFTTACVVSWHHTIAMGTGFSLFLCVKIFFFTGKKNLDWGVMSCGAGTDDGKMKTPTKSPEHSWDTGRWTMWENKRRRATQGSGEEERHRGSGRKKERRKKQPCEREILAPADAWYPWAFGSEFLAQVLGQSNTAQAPVVLQCTNDTCSWHAAMYPFASCCLLSVSLVFAHTRRVSKANRWHRKKKKDRKKGCTYCSWCPLPRIYEVIVRCVTLKLQTNACICFRIMCWHFDSNVFMTLLL